MICSALFVAGCNETAAPPPEGEWYKGDLHCHSTHSDGDSSVQDVIASAESKGLDFFVINALLRGFTKALSNPIYFNFSD